MTTPFTSILTTPSIDSIRAMAIAVYRAVGFQATSWAPADPGRVALELLTRGIYDLQIYAQNVGRQGLLEYATKDNLTVLARDRYEEERTAAEYTKGTIQLSNANVTNEVFAAQTLVVTARNTLTYTNATQITIPAGSALTVEITATEPGAAYNVGSNDLVLSSVRLGVAINAISVNWISQSGRDVEQDESLKARCSAKWGSLTYTGPTDAYEALIRNAVPAITRIGFARNVPATWSDPDAYITVATPAGAASATELAAAVAAIDTYTSLGHLMEVRSAVNVPYTISGTISVRGVSASAYRDSAIASVQETLSSWQIGMPVPDDIIIKALSTDGFVSSNVYYLEGSRNLRSGGTTGSLGSASVYVLNAANLNVGLA